MSDNDKLIKRENIRSLLTNPHQQPLDAQKIIERIPKTAPISIQELASSQIELLTVYHNAVLEEAKRSFQWALTFAFIGFLFLLVSLGFAIYIQVATGVVSAISSMLIELIAVVNFNSYGKYLRQLGDFQNRLDDIQRILLANSMSEKLEGDFKQQAHLEVIKTLLDFTNKKEK